MGLGPHANHCSVLKNGYCLFNVGACRVSDDVDEGAVTRMNGVVYDSAGINYEVG